MPTLIVNEPGKNEPLVHKCSEDVITIGRLESNVVNLLSAGVSRRHAKIVKEGESFFLVDMRSGNGTFLNGMQLKPEDKNLLKAGDQITIAEFNLDFHIGDEAFEVNKAEEVTDSDILEVKLLKKVLTALDKETVPSIEVLNGSAEGKKFFFTDEISEIVIGRDPECDFPINEYVVSRKHAKISKRWGGIAIRDIESKNGTFLNNRRVVEEFLHDGDRIALGTIVLIFRNPQEINLANLEDVKPKNKPAPVAPEDIPGVEATGETPMPAEEELAETSEEIPEEEAGEEIPEIKEEGEETSGEEESSAMDEWERLEEAPEGAYPTPHAAVEKIKTLTPVEIGMIGLGALVFIFALITIVNLMTS